MLRGFFFSQLHILLKYLNVHFELIWEVLVYLKLKLFIFHIYVKYNESSFSNNISISSTNLELVRFYLVLARIPSLSGNLRKRDVSEL